MKDLHSQGKSMEEIVQVLKRTPMHPQIVPAIEAAYSLGYALKLITSLYVLLFLFIYFSCLPNKQIQLY